MLGLAQTFSFPTDQNLTNQVKNTESTHSKIKEKIGIQGLDGAAPQPEAESFERRLEAALLALDMPPPGKASGKTLPRPLLESQPLGASSELITEAGSEPATEEALFALAIAQGVAPEVAAAVLWSSSPDGVSDSGAGGSGSPASGLSVLWARSGEAGAVQPGAAKGAGALPVGLVADGRAPVPVGILKGAGDSAQALASLGRASSGGTAPAGGVAVQPPSGHGAGGSGSQQAMASVGTVGTVVSGAMPDDALVSLTDAGAVRFGSGALAAKGGASDVRSANPMGAGLNQGAADELNGSLQPKAGSDALIDPMLRSSRGVDRVNPFASLDDGAVLRVSGIRSPDAGLALAMPVPQWMMKSLRFEPLVSQSDAAPAQYPVQGGAGSQAPVLAQPDSAPPQELAGASPAAKFENALDLSTVRDVDGGPDRTPADRDAMQGKLADALAQRMMNQVQRGQWSLQLELKPADLGQISIEMTLHNGRLEAMFDASSSAARALISDGLDRLRQELERAGMNVAQLGMQGASGGSSGGKPTPGRSERGQQAGDEGDAGRDEDLALAAEGRRREVQGLDLMV